ncbi:hypothetical protein CN934_29050 [Ensifer sp. MMN_5]|nr:hypothetical protein CN934_29050 [Ensifer sp. MMN_5]
MGAQPRQMQFTNVVCIGAGNIGAGWVAQFLIAGLDVVVYDPAPEREAWLHEYLVRAMPNLERLGLAPVADTSLVRSTSGLEDAPDGAKFVQESSPENLESKIGLMERITDLAPVEAIVASSSAGFLRQRLAVQSDGAGSDHHRPPVQSAFYPLAEIAGGEDAPEPAASAVNSTKRRVRGDRAQTEHRRIHRSAGTLSMPMRKR